LLVKKLIGGTVIIFIRSLVSFLSRDIYSGREVVYVAQTCMDINHGGQRGGTNPQNLKWGDAKCKLSPRFSKIPLIITEIRHFTRKMHLFLGPVDPYPSPGGPNLLLRTKLPWICPLIPQEFQPDLRTCRHVNYRKG